MRRRGRFPIRYLRPKSGSATQLVTNDSRRRKLLEELAFDDLLRGQGRTPLPGADLAEPTMRGNFWSVPPRYRSGQAILDAWGAGHLTRDEVVAAVLYLADDDSGHDALECFPEELREYVVRAAWQDTEGGGPRQGAKPGLPALSRFASMTVLLFDARRRGCVTEAGAFGIDPDDDEPAPWPWPSIDDGAYRWGQRMKAATPTERAAVFAEAAQLLSPDLVEWDKFLRGTRVRHPDFVIPARWEDWDLGKEMSKWLPPLKTMRRSPG